MRVCEVDDIKTQPLCCLPEAELRRRRQSQSQSQREDLKVVHVRHSDRHSQKWLFKSGSKIILLILWVFRRLFEFSSALEALLTVSADFVLFLHWRMVWDNYISKHSFESKVCLAEWGLRR